MKSIYETLLNLKSCLINPNPESLAMSLNDVHHNNIFSLVVDGTEPGKLLRVFIAGKRLRPFEVQLHTHRYPINLTVIKGNITHHIAVETKPRQIMDTEMSKWAYTSPMNGGNGLSYIGQVGVAISDYKMPPGSTVRLGCEDYHTMSVSKGSIWMVEELGFEKESSLVLGVPFITEGLYNKPEMFQVNDKCVFVLKEVSKLVDHYAVIASKSINEKLKQITTCKK